MNAVASVLLSPLQGLLSYLQKDRHHRDDKKDSALHAINTALIETKKYIEQNGGVSFDRDREFHLAQLWADASVKARHVSTDVATRLNDKSTYWSKKLKWSSEEVLSRRIDIDSLQEQVNELISDSKW